MAGMAADPEELDLMAFHGRLQALPEIDILDRLLVRGLPAIALPAVQPAGDPLLQIAAVGVKPHDGGTLQGLERGDGSHQLHAIVGGGPLPALELALMRACAQHRAPAAGAGITAAG